MGQKHQMAGNCSYSDKVLETTSVVESGCTHFLVNRQEVNRHFHYDLISFKCFKTFLLKSHEKLLFESFFGLLKREERQKTQTHLFSTERRVWNVKHGMQELEMLSG